MSESNQEWERIVKRQVETNLFYFVVCSHCETVFLIEESIDKQPHHGEGDPTFQVTCPRCETIVTQAAIRRLKLRLDRVLEEDEVNPYLLELADKLEIVDRDGDLPL